MVDSVQLKRCDICKTLKPMSEFASDSTRSRSLHHHCRSCVSVYWHKYHETKKIKVLSHYGVDGECKCVFCGESRVVCLSLDHVNGDGYRSTERLGKSGRNNNRMCSGQLYSWVINNNFPSGYQTLCMNCQYVKRAENKEYYTPPSRKIVSKGTT